MTGDDQDDYGYWDDWDEQGWMTGMARDDCDDK